MRLHRHRIWLCVAVAVVNIAASSVVYAYLGLGKECVITGLFSVLTNASFFLAQFVFFRAELEDQKVSPTARVEPAKRTRTRLGALLIVYGAVLFSFVLMNVFAALEYHEVEWLRASRFVGISAEDASRLDAGMIGTAQNTFLIPFYVGVGLVAGRSRPYLSFLSLLAAVVLAELTSWAGNHLSYDPSTLQLTQAVNILVLHRPPQSALPGSLLTFVQLAVLGLVALMSVVIASTIWLSALLVRGGTRLARPPGFA